MDVWVGLGLSVEAPAYKVAALIPPTSNRTVLRLVGSMPASTLSDAFRFQAGLGAAAFRLGHQPPVPRAGGGPFARHVPPAGHRGVHGAGGDARYASGRDGVAAVGTWGWTVWSGLWLGSPDCGQG